MATSNKFSPPDQAITDRRLPEDPMDPTENRHVTDIICMPSSIVFVKDHLAPQIDSPLRAIKQGHRGITGNIHRSPVHIEQAVKDKNNPQCA